MPTTPPLDLRFRQNHLDFYISEGIAGIGADFDAGEFANTLAHAHVDSITYDCGMNLFDTAELYGIPNGLSEMRLGTASPSRCVGRWQRECYRVATLIGSLH